MEWIWNGFRFFVAAFLILTISNAVGVLLGWVWHKILTKREEVNPVVGIDIEGRLTRDPSQVANRYGAFKMRQADLDARIEEAFAPGGPIPVPEPMPCPCPVCVEGRRMKDAEFFLKAAGLDEEEVDLADATWPDVTGADITDTIPTTRSEEDNAQG